MSLILQLILVIATALCFASPDKEKLPTGQYLVDPHGEVTCEFVRTKEKVRLHKVPVLTIQHFKNAVVAYPSVGRRRHPFILIELTTEGQRLFYEFTKQHVGSASGTVIDGKLYTAIITTTALAVQELEVDAHVSKREIKRLVDVLNKEIKANQL